jgi:hypothetical protein
MTPIAEFNDICFEETTTDNAQRSSFFSPPDSVEIQNLAGFIGSWRRLVHHHARPSVACIRRLDALEGTTPSCGKHSSGHPGVHVGGALAIGLAKTEE